MNEKILRGSKPFPEPEIPGNTARIAALMNRIRNESGRYTIAVLGGSISEGVGASSRQMCYGYQVYQWWARTFPNAAFTFVNAGIGSTNPEMGCYRFDRDFGAFKPDFAVFDYADNTYLDERLALTVPTLLYKMLSSGTAVMGIYFSRTNRVKFDRGEFEQDANVPIPDHKLACALKTYAIPTVNYHAYVWEKMRDGVISWKDIGSDYIHPNDTGHTIGAAMITAFLDKIAQSPDEYAGEITEPSKPGKDTYLNAYNIVKGDSRVTLDGAMNPDAGDTAGRRGWNCSSAGSLTVSLPQERKHVKILMQISGAGSVLLSGADREKKLTSSDAVSPTLISVPASMGDEITILARMCGGNVHIYYIGID